MKLASKKFGWGWPIPRY